MVRSSSTLSEVWVLAFGRGSTRFDMKRLCVAVIVALACGTLSVSAQAPRFSDYAATVQPLKAKSVDFKNSPRMAKTFKTRLTNEFRKGINFAGRFILVAWGCGTGCRDGAIIDGDTGRVIIPKEIGAVSDWYGPPAEDFDMFTFQKDSRLLVVRGFPGYAGKKAGTYYLEWRGTRFRLLEFIPYREI
jgi:hypothetical protein